MSKEVIIKLTSDHIKVKGGEYVRDYEHGEWICHKGKWIDFDYYPTKYECSQCHHYVDVASDKNFCPNCGARMKGSDDE